MNKTITIETRVKKDRYTVWNYWTKSEHIVAWAHATDDLECAYAENNLRVGGKFLFRLAAKNKSVSFDFTGRYTHFDQPHAISYTIDDGRAVTITFIETEGAVRIVETFEMEQEHTEEIQRAGWQRFLNNFTAYIEKSIQGVH